MTPKFCITLSLLMVATVSAETITFEGLPVNGGGFFNGDINAGSPLRDNYTSVGTQPNIFDATKTDHLQRWTIGGVEFNNSYTPQDPPFIDSWVGWSWSTVSDTVTPGLDNQYAAAPGSGAGGSQTYAVAFSDEAFFNLPSGASLQSVDVTNGTFGWLSMLNGDAFSDPFGGISGTEPDLFQVTLTGFSELDEGGLTTGSVTIDLADYRAADPNNDFILTDWQTVDLTPLGSARSVGLTFASTDTSFGFINQPTYLFVDNLTFATAIPEPSSVAVLGSVCGLLVWRRRTRRSVKDQLG